MSYLAWILKLGLFVVVLTFAVKNTDTVTVRYYLGAEWQAPLIFVLLVFFSFGAALGVAASFAQLLRHRREIAALQRELSGRQAVTPEAGSLDPDSGVRPAVAKAADFTG